MDHFLLWHWVKTETRDGKWGDLTLPRLPAALGQAAWTVAYIKQAVRLWSSCHHTLPLAKGWILFPGIVLQGLVSSGTIYSYTGAERQHCLQKPLKGDFWHFCKAKGLKFCRQNLQVNNSPLGEAMESCLLGRFKIREDSKHNWTQPHAGCWGWPCSVQGAGQGHFQRCQPAPTLLWACHSVNSKLCLLGLDMLRHDWQFPQKNGTKLRPLLLPTMAGFLCYSAFLPHQPAACPAGSPA